MTTAMALPPDLAGKLVKILGMLGSDFDGEIAAAGRRANALVKGAGLTWDQVIAPTVPALWQPPPKPQQRQPDHTRRRFWRPVQPGNYCAAQCLLWPEVLTDWEVDFCRSILGRKRRISAKQVEVLERISAKVEMFARAAGEAGE